MQTKTKTKLFSALLSGALMMGVVFVGQVNAANLSSNLSVFTLYESAGQGPTETEFILSLVPEPTDQVTTTFSTNAECTLGHNRTDYASGGAIVTQNDKLTFGLRSVDDTDGEGQHACDIRFSSVSASDPEYATPVELEYSIQIVDDDLILVPDYSLSTLTSARLEEGDTFVEQYQIDISYAPAYDIAVTAIADSQCDMLVGAPQQRSKQAVATFSAGSTAPIRFTLIPVDDGDFEGIHQCSISHVTTTLDDDFQPVSLPGYTATVFDNEGNPNIPDATILRSL